MMIIFKKLKKKGTTVKSTVKSTVKGTTHKTYLSS